MIYKCKDCKARHIGCHATCRKYHNDTNRKKQEVQIQKLELIASSAGSHNWSFIKEKKVKG